MYERMLDKNIVPTFEDLVDYAKDSGRLWIELDEWIKEQYKASVYSKISMYGRWLD